MINKNDWSNLTFSQLEDKYSMNREEIYIAMIKNKAYNIRPVIEKIKMGNLEDKYIKNSSSLSVTQLANMFHKSHNAMLIHVKTKGYYQIVGRRNN